VSITLLNLCLAIRDSLYNLLVCVFSFVVMEIVVSIYYTFSLLFHYYLHSIPGLTMLCELQIATQKLMVVIFFFFFLSSQEMN
jgi:hypothetical protein